tara:strand:- start:1175 stop:1477 length:303 start_codon:yes stop_codon:yes gene_type:complete
MSEKLYKTVDGVRSEMTDEEAAAYLSSITIQTQEELKAESMRLTRLELLSATDVYMLSDFPLTDSQKTELLNYRQALRDLPTQSGFPNVDFPTKPSFIGG